MMKKKMMGKVAALAEFDEALYSVGGGEEEAADSYARYTVGERTV